MICSVCKLDKPEIEFYLSNQNTCKVCCKLRWAKRRSDNIELVRAYDRNRPNKKERQQKQKEYKERMRKENPEKYDRIFHGLRKRYSARHKEKIRAEGLVNDAIRYGKPCKGLTNSCVEWVLVRRVSETASTEVCRAEVHRSAEQ